MELGRKTSTESGSLADLDGTETVTGVKASETEYMQFTFDEERFNQERQLWNNQNIQNYSYEQSQDMPGGYRFRVTVENGNVVEEEVLEDAGILRRWDSVTGTYGDKPPRYLKGTLSDAYVHLEECILSYKSLFHPDGYTDGVKIVINYDPVYHFPTSWEFIEYCNVLQDYEIITTIVTEHTLTGSKEISRTVKVIYGPVRVGITHENRYLFGVDGSTKIYDFTPTN
jgi:hypothetical protein